MKVMAYYRVSGKSQIVGDGFPRQKASVEAWAAVNGGTVVNEYREEGVTGDSTWTDRPAFEAMLAAILSNGVRTIVVENLGRLARNFVTQDSLLTYLASRGISLISADTGACVTDDIKADPAKKAMIQMMAVFAELEKNSLVRKLKAARQRKKEATGRCEGRHPFGHRPGEQETIERMRELRAMHKSFAKIGWMLDREDRPTRTGKPWGARTIQGILKRVNKKPRKKTTA